jgi:hypothetical protein
MTDYYFFLDELKLEKLKVGYLADEKTNLDIYIITHPYYWIAHDEMCGMFYMDYKDAYMAFEIHNN